MPPPSHVSQRTSASFSSTPSLVPVTTRPSASSLSTPSPTRVTHSPPSADKSHATVSLPSSSLVILQPTASQSSSVTSSPSLPKPQTAIRGGRAIRRPARYSDCSQDATLNSDCFLVLGAEYLLLKTSALHIDR